MSEFEQYLSGGEATERLGAALAQHALAGTVIFLFGELGAGKTTLVRGFLQGLGHYGAVKSPTYTLVETYDLLGRRYYHFDLYRLGSPEELEYLGIRDYFDGEAVALVEWPQRGVGILPGADLEIHLEYKEGGRLARLRALTARGDALLAAVEKPQSG